MKHLSKTLQQIDWLKWTLASRSIINYRFRNLRSKDTYPMTRPELHELVDIVMDARERTKKALKLEIFSDVHFWDHSKEDIGWIRSGSFRTFSDFTQAVKEYIKTLE